MSPPRLPRHSMFEPPTTPPVLHIYVRTTNREVARQLVEMATGDEDTIEAVLDHGSDRENLRVAGPEVNFHGVDEDRVREIVNQYMHEVMRELSQTLGLR